VTRKRLQRFFLFFAGTALCVIVGVWVAHQFPALTHGPKSSGEILESMFKAPARLIGQPTEYLRRHLKQEAVELFLRSCDLPNDVEGRLLAMVRGERFKEVTVPFVFFLYELYGAPQKADAIAVEDLAYAEPAEPKRGEEARAGLSGLVRRSPLLRRHVSRSLRLFDALFLQVKPGPAEKDLPVLERYDEKSYADIRALVREAARDFLTDSDDALSQGTQENEYQAMLKEILQDDRRLGEFIEFLADYIRQQSESWLESFVHRRQRKEARLTWVEERIHGNRYFEISDYALGRAERRLVVHVVVDGLQGKLLEGLVQLSSGDREGSGARYVAELVRLHENDRMNPLHYASKLPPSLGQDVLALVGRAPERPDYLENFKKYCFSPGASAVTVDVATVDTPSISVRNLPIVMSGHPAAGPFGTGIPNFSYLDRPSRRGWYFWGSDLLHMQRIFGNREEEISSGQKRRQGPGAKTLFERLWQYNTVSSMATIDGGALEKIASEVGLTMGEIQRNYAEKLMILRLRQRAQMEEELNRRRRWLREHRRLSRSFLGSLLFQSEELRTFHDYARFLAEHEDDGLPDYLLWYNPWPDHFAHAKGPYSDAIIGFQGEYDRLDFYLGKLVQVYESTRTADGGSSFAERTLFGVVSDHGLIYTPQLVSTDKLLFEAMRAEGVRITYQKLTHDEGGLPDIHGRNAIKPTYPFDAVVGSTAGGSYVIDLFLIRGLQGDDAAWQQHPDYHQLRRHRLLSGQTIDWIEQLQRHLAKTMDLALVREYGPESGQQWPSQTESVVRIVTPDRGEARIHRVRKSAGSAAPAVWYRYEVLGEQDPLDLAGSVREYLTPPEGPSVKEAQAAIRGCMESPTGCADHTWRELLSYTERPDVVYQFSGLYDSERAGTINIFPVLHVGMNSGVAGRHAGEAFGEKNGTQLYFGAGLKRRSIQTARNGSLPVTLYHWLVGDEYFHAPQGDGSAAQQFGYESLLGNPAFRSVLQPIQPASDARRAN